jgi:hypothetical protein
MNSLFSLLVDVLLLKPRSLATKGNGPTSTTLGRTFLNKVSNVADLIIVCNY